MANSIRHYGKFQREEVVVLGYNKTRNDALICFVNAMPSDDQNELREIASSEAAQKEDYLIAFLKNIRHTRANENWADYILKNTRWYATQSLKNIEDMEPGQLSFFKGYGRSAKDEVPVEEPVRHPRPNQPGAQGTDPTLLAILQSLVEGQNKMAAALENLETKVKSPKAKKPSKAAKPAKVIRTKLDTPKLSVLDLHREAEAEAEA